MSYVDLASKVEASERTVRTQIVYEVSGEADLVALVHVDDTMALRALLDKMWLAAPNEIASTTTELVLEQY